MRQTDLLPARIFINKGRKSQSLFSIIYWTLALNGDTRFEPVPKYSLVYFIHKILLKMSPADFENLFFTPFTPNSFHNLSSSIKVMGEELVSNSIPRA